jgi:hypothetical protein
MKTFSEELQAISSEAQNKEAQGRAQEAQNRKIREDYLFGAAVKLWKVNCQEAAARGDSRAVIVVSELGLEAYWTGKTAFDENHPTTTYKALADGPLARLMDYAEEQGVKVVLEATQMVGARPTVILRSNWKA